ncbi:helix-turn-helix domain-containing protein, partial [Enterococcus cecorum]
MNNLGKYFKKFRESRHLTLKNIANESLSMAQLSRFENGTSDLTISKFLYSLNELNMSLEEFMYTVNNYKMSPLSELLLKINEYSITRNDKSLKKLLYTQ